MKFKTTLITFASLILLLTSCMQAANNRKSANSNEEEQESSGLILDNPTAASWYAKGQYVEGPLTLSSSDTENIYLVGGVVNNYLVDQQKTNQPFCLIASINNLTDPINKRPQARFKVVPVKSSQTQETSFRINLSNEIDNKAFCSGDNIQSYDGAGNLQTYSANQAAYSLSTICPTCNSSFTTTKLRIHHSSNGVATNNIIPSSSISLNSLSITISATSTVTDPTGSCTNTSCQSQGYGCCLNGQCVIDGEVRPETDQTSSEYQTALAEILNDENSFQNYPNLFFVCPIHVQPDDGDDDNTTDPIDEANQSLLKDIEDYKCLLGQTVHCDPDVDSVRVKVWQKCGCQFEPTYVAGELQLDSRCIDYGLKATKDANDNITNITCDIPVAENEDQPFQNLSVLVSGKSAPHRFYSLSGTPYDDLSEIPEGTNQEGDTFFYLDAANKAGPVESTYSMNSIIGQMTLDLQQAQPAKAIDIEVDNVYIISVTSGYATPCPYCQQDAWQKVFSSHPESNRGYGLTWRGYTTDRQAIGSNTTYGNYEDTIFGRACWVPPTMIPNAHKSYPSAGVQRRNRLEAQAAMYVNGYQRDWFGFNQGALIGSFDGTSWFAIGAGRRVRSTTQKLFLAINAPFADLSQNTNYTVSVIEDLGGQTAADFEWDFTKTASDITQNYGASCQYMHSCETDSDCVSKLGWEYTCGQVTDMRTNWPKYDIEAFEKNNYTREAVSLSSILATNISGGQNKRCVYRGAGAPCKLNPNDNVKKQSQQKLLTCAPNFYCAALDSGNFTKELIRSPNEPSGILFGQAANVLGRPAQYMDRTSSLPISVQEAIATNLSAYAATGTYGAGDVGLCVPGRSVNATQASNTDDEQSGIDAFVSRHQTRDPLERTDYISQIGICDETLSGINQTRSCPVFDDEGNYFYSENSDINIPSVLQNMCSRASVDDSTNLSVFKTIEAPRLSEVLQLHTESLAANACLRRAGSICHTNLDCGPNRLHADIARGLSPASFGGTMAEQQFWEEELVCGQSKEEPLLNTILAADYYNYDMSKNLCCREISKDFTMYTAVGSSTTLPGYNVQNETLDASINNAEEAGRYSRYLASKTFSTSSVSMSVDENAVPSANQALVINETGRSNCCGGGFIRKFEDGTNNWTSGGRLSISPSNLACMNYSMKSWQEPITVDGRSNWLMEYSYMSAIGGYRNYSSGGQPFVWLKAGDPIGSIQANIDEESIDPPQVINTTNPIGGRISLYPADESGTLFNTKIAYGIYQETGTNDTYNAPYSPVILKPNRFNNPIAPALGRDDLDQRTLAIYIPEYIDTASILANDEVVLNYITDADATDFSGLADLTIQTADFVYSDCSGSSLSSISTTLGSASTEPVYCILEENGFKYMLFSVINYTSTNPTFELGWPSFTFNIKDDAFGTKPGGQKYYERIMEKYELLGVPQVTYEAIRCNDQKYDPAQTTTNIGRLVDGIYNSVTDPFQTDSIGGGALSIDSKVHYKTDGSTISLPQIFSADEFKCCSKLGTNVTDPGSMCCSGFGVLNADNTYECRLPSGTDLNTYLNLFISSEGIVTDNVDLSLDPETDYVQATGFPDIEEDDVVTKITQIGIRFCQQGTVRNGAAFDKYYPQPAAGYFTDDDQLTQYNSIVDSMDDLTATDSNYTSFISGFRWNSHIYCD